MKASRLAELLMRTPDFDVKVSVVTVDDQTTGFAAIDYKNLNVTGIADTGYSDKVVVIDTEEED